MGLAVIEHTEHPFAKGDLTADGIQWSAEKDTATADTDVEVESAVAKTNIGTTYIEETRSGCFKPVANFDSVPFEVRLIIQCNEANQGRAKIKNSSYVRVKYSAS